MTQFASGRHSESICDRCGLTVKYTALKRQFIDRADSGLLVCSECLDIDHEQYDVGRYPIFDPQALRNPRPDNNRLQGVSLFGWNPLLGQQANAILGSVTVTVT
jgi:hypothetical protein